MPEGQGFIKHEFDEAIAIQQCVVAAGRQLGEAHPLPEAQQALKEQLKVDERHLQQLQQFGGEFGATGEVEDVAGGMIELMQQTLAKATEDESEAYEAHAVLLSLKRKQQDSSMSVMKIAKEIGNRELRDAAVEMNKEIKGGAEQMADLLATFAVRIATQGQPQNA